jgi:hypothetical protein
LVHVATSVYYNRDLEKERKDLEKENRKDKWQEALITVLRGAPPGQSPNLRTYFQRAQAGHFRRVCPWRKLPLGPCPICQGTKTRASHPITGPWASHPGSVTTIKAEESHKSIRSASLSILEPTFGYSFLSWTQILQENYCLRHIRPASRALFHSAFSLLLGRFPFLSLLFNCPRNPYPSARVRPSI